MRARSYLGAHRSARGKIIPVLLILAGSLGVVVATAGLMRFIDEPSLPVALIIPAAAIVGLALFMLPVHVLPSIVLVILALFPSRLIPNEGPFNALPPLAILMGIWLFRRIVLGHRAPGEVSEPEDAARMGPRFAVYATATLFTAWLLVSIALVGGGETSVGWTMSFVAGALLPLLVFDARAEARMLKITFLIVGALVGLYLIGEMLLGTSPLYGTIEGLLGAGGIDDEELEFSVYRARAGFAHPLFAAAFLTIPAALGIGSWLTTGKRWHLVLGGIAAAGVVATVSRGSILAIAIAVTIGVVLSPFVLGWANLKRWLQLLVLTVIGGVTVLNFGPLVERSESIESELSATVRERAVEIAILAARQSNWLGTGPGTSGETGRLFDTIVIENSLLQLLISVGLPGLILFLAFVASLAWCALRHRDIAVVMALAAYTVSITGFNSLDAVRNMHVVIGFLVILAVNSSAPRLAATSPALMLPNRVLSPA